MDTMSKKRFEDTFLDQDDLNMEEAHNMLDSMYDEEDVEYWDEEDTSSLDEFMSKVNKERR